MIAHHLARYTFPKYQAIPLRKWDAKSKNKHGVEREDGKRPRDTNWTKRPYVSERIVRACLHEKMNVGIRLQAHQLVIDVDPRNGGEEGFKNLCDDLLLDPADWEEVTGDTGSGGWHIYLDKPADVPVRDTLPDYPGVEFKSIGRQVVSMGSRHPNGTHYKWRTPDIDLPSIAAPQALLNLIVRPQSNAMTSGGQIDEEQAAKILEELDPTDFDSNDTWQPLMMAFHHATAGAGRQVFTDWSCGDPKFAEDADVIGRRWDSCDEDKQDELTYKSINKILRDKQLNSFQIRPDNTAEDFAELDAKAELFTDDPSPIEELFGDDDKSSEDEYDKMDFEAEELSALEKINTEFAAVMVGGKFRIVSQTFDQVLDRTFWTYIADRDFKLWKGNTRIMRDKDGLAKSAAETQKLGDAWIEWPRRKQYSGVVFAPGKEHAGALNLWTGWKFIPSGKGSWDRLNELIQEAICDGDSEIYDYVINWIRYLFQFPGKRAETAVVMQGGKGVGKGTLGNVINNCIGRHALSIASPELITGRFNSHLQDCVFLFADEAIRAHDKPAESRLKNMITEPFLAFEAKGMDVVTGANLLHVMMATNEDWAVPASIDERRFLVTKVNTSWQGKQSKFNALFDELERNDNAGYKRFLFDMLNPKIDPAWHPRAVPSTVQLGEQKLRSLSPMGQWLYNIAEAQHFPFPLLGDAAARNSTRRCRAFFIDVRDSFIGHCNEAGIKPGNMGRSSTRFFLQELEHLLPDVKVNMRDKVPEDRLDIEASKSDGRAASVDFPPIGELRSHFERTLKQKIKWTLQAIKDEPDFG